MKPSKLQTILICASFFICFAIVTKLSAEGIDCGNGAHLKIIDVGKCKFLVGDASYYDYGMLEATYPIKNPKLSSTSGGFKTSATFTESGKKKGEEKELCGYVFTYEKVDSKVLMHVDLNYLEIVPKRIDYKFQFPLISPDKDQIDRDNSAGATCEVVKGGQTKTYNLASKEVETQENVDKITIRKKDGMVILEPGKDCQLNVFDTRKNTRDTPKILVYVQAKNQNYKANVAKGGKDSLEAFIQFEKIPMLK